MNWCFVFICIKNHKTIFFFKNSWFFFFLGMRSQWAVNILHHFIIKLLIDLHHILPIQMIRLKFNEFLLHFYVIQCTSTYSAWRHNSMVAHLNKIIIWPPFLSLSLVLFAESQLRIIDGTRRVGWRTLSFHICGPCGLQDSTGQMFKGTVTVYLSNLSNFIQLRRI